MDRLSRDGGEKIMPTEAEVGAEVADWLKHNWDPDLTVAEWWDRLCDSGWAVPTWPEEWYGRGLSRDLARVVTKEIHRAGALGPPGGLGLGLAGPTIIAHGSQEQKARYVRNIVSGQEGWCQLFSEPGAGSDLAGLQTRAVRDGDEWVVNGQKVWTSTGMFADLGMLLARTNVEVPKHKGISYFAFPMRQDGVDVRPLREMTGRALFCEVFFDDNRVHNDALIGGLDNGWNVARTTLAVERQGIGGGGSAPASAAAPGTVAGHLERRVGDFVGKAQGSALGGGALFARSNKILLQAARERGVTDDPVIRQGLAYLHSLHEISRYTMLRAKAAMKAGKRPGPEANVAKIANSRMVRLSRDLGLQIIGPGGMLAGEDAPLAGVLHELCLFSPAPSIYGGTDQVQRNIIGEQALGLPREPGDSHKVPFKDLVVGTQQKA